MVVANVVKEIESLKIGQKDNDMDRIKLDDEEGCDSDIMLGKRHIKRKTVA